MCFPSHSAEQANQTSPTAEEDQAKQISVNKTVLKGFQWTRDALSYGCQAINGNIRMTECWMFHKYIVTRTVWKDEFQKLLHLFQIWPHLHGMQKKTGQREYTRHDILKCVQTVVRMSAAGRNKWSMSCRIRLHQSYLASRSCQVLQEPGPHSRQETNDIH